MAEELQPGLTVGRKILVVLAITCVTTLLSTSAILLGTFDELENRTWDWRLQKVSEFIEPDPRIKIITIDQKSLEFAAEQLGVRWLWPRDMYEPVVKYLQNAGAKAMAFDILFTESTNYSYELDLSFAESVKGEVPVVSALVLSDHSPPELASTLELFEKVQTEKNLKFESHSLTKEIPTAFGHYSSVTLPYPELLEASSLLGSVKSESDSDGIYRHIEVGGLWNDIPVLNLPFALALAGSHDASSILSSISSSLDEHGKLAVRFLGKEQSIPTYSYAAILTSFHQLQEGMEPNVALEEFKGAYVLIGMTAPGLKDLRPSPLAKEFPGVEYNATVLDNILQKRFVRKVSPNYNAVIASFLGFFIALLALLIGQLRYIIPIFLTTIALYVTVTYFLALQGWWIHLFVPIIVMFGSLLLALAAQYYLEGRQRSFLKGAFGHFVSPYVVDQIVRNPEKLSLGGERRELTIFFSDIAGFTSLSEHLEPEKLVKLLNEYLSILTDLLLASGGTLDKYEGDAIIAFWNAPIEIEDHPKKAVRAAIACQQKLESMRSYFEEHYQIFPRTRIGMNTGVVTVGNFGSASRFDYTMIGDATNLAARLEGVNKVFGTDIILSEATYSRLDGEISCRRIGRVRVVGKKEVITLYEPVNSRLSDGELAQFDEALKFFEAREFNQASKLFEQLARLDPVSQSYLQRLGEERESLNDESWDPTWNLVSK